jgi:hypothetical protein
MNCKQVIAVCLILSTQVLRAESLTDAVKRSGTKDGIVVHIGCGDISKIGNKHKA